MQPGSPIEQLQSRRACRLHSFWSLTAARALIAALLLAQTPAATPATPPKPTEYDVKAAYLLNFGKFVRTSRPIAPNSSFDICTLGRDPINPSLDAIASNSTIDGRRPVRVTHLPDITGAKSCQILFLGNPEENRIREDLAILGNADILTVSDAPDFLQHGGMIQFVLVSNHVRFAVNLEAVNHTHLVLSSELLRVASSVAGKPPTGEMP
jgi:hypothetical protein